MLEAPRCSHHTGFALLVWVCYWQSLEFCSDTVSTKNGERDCPGVAGYVMLSSPTLVGFEDGRAELCNSQKKRVCFRLLD